MKQLFEPATAAEVKARLGHLRPDSERRWGTMSAAQAVEHCARGLEQALGDRRPPRMLVGRLLGWAIKPLALGNDAPFRPNSPTVPELVVADARDLDVARARLIGLMDRVVASGPAGCTTHPHSFFGRLRPDEWGELMYKHLDHHLRQFGV